MENATVTKENSVEFPQKTNKMIRRSKNVTSMYTSETILNDVSQSSLHSHIA